MDDLNALCPAVQGHLLRALEGAGALRNRGEWFLWTQGAFQSLIPHALLVAVLLDERRRPVHVECLRSVVMEPGVLQDLCHEQDGWVVRAAALCREQGWRMLTLSTEPGQAPTAAQELARQWAGFGLGHAMLVDTGALGSAGSGFFAVLGMAQAMDTGPVLLRALLPQLHLALLQVVNSLKTSSAGPSPKALRTEFTERQVEILHWIKLGKTNYEISQILGISALTVKNHLQKLFKKLDVHNRAQAVASSMAMDLGEVPLTGLSSPRQKV